MIGKAVVNWLKTKEAHPHEITEAYAVFLQETQIDFPKIQKIRSLKRKVLFATTKI